MPQRGRPKSDGELKDSSVRIRPGLKAQLEAAAAESGESIAKELEERLHTTFTEVPTRGVTRELLQALAAEVKRIEAHTGKQWDKDLATWAILREVLANGPITRFLPHPNEAEARNAVAANAEMAELQAERGAISKMLRGFGIEPDPTPVLGAKTLNIPVDDRSAVRQSVEQRDDLPLTVRGTLLEQLARLDELDPAIATLSKQVAGAVLPYHKAKREARQWLYGIKGVPDLPEWFTAPYGFDEAPPRRSGMFAAS